MKQSGKQFIGSILIVTAAIGFCLCAAGIFGVWRLKTSFTNSFTETLTVAANTLEVTAGALDTAADSIATVKTNVSSLHATTLTVGQTINDVIPVLDAFAALMADDLPTTIESTQTSLESAQASAKLIDGMLTAINSIPFYSGTIYDPEVPLHVALANVSANMASLPPSFRDISEDMSANNDNLTQLEDEIFALALSINDINTNLDEVAGIVIQYQLVVSDMSNRVTSLQTKFPIWMTSFTWGATVLFVWLGFTQLGLLTQGLELFFAGTEKDEMQPQSANKKTNT